MSNLTANDYAAIYARRSTKLENNSINSQIELAKDIIRDKNLFIYDIYSDKESATKYHPLHRPGFKQLMYGAMKGHFKTVVVFRRDRLARRVEDLIEIKNIFKQYGVKIVYSNPGEYQCDDSFISNFIENIIMAVDELEPSILAERIAAGKREKKERGEYVCGGTPTFGFTRGIKNDKRYYYENTKVSHIIRKAFEEFNKLDEKKPDYNNLIETINAYSCDRKFTISELTKLIQKPIYGGLIFLDFTEDSDYKLNITDIFIKNPDTNDFQINKNLFRSCINADSIIKANDWYETILKWRRITPSRNSLKSEEKIYLFKGLLKCLKCYKPMYLVENHYRCTLGCSKVPEHILLDTLLDNIFVHILTTNNIKDYMKKQTEDYDKNLEDLHNELTAEKNRQNKILLDIIKGSSPNIENIKDNPSLKESINKEKELFKKVNARKEAATVLNSCLAKLQQIVKIKDKTMLINMFRRNIYTSQQLLSEIIEEVKINRNTDTSTIKFK